MGLDYYGILELNRNCTDDDIKKAYRKLSLKFHPNRNKDSNAPKRFEAVSEAYDVLSSAKWKVLYDQFGEEGIKTGVPLPPGPNEVEGPIEIYTFHGDSTKVFRDFFGVDSPFADYYLPNLDPSYKFFEEPAKPVPGPDIEHIFELSLEDAFYGTTKSIELPLQVVDETGTRTVDTMKTFTFHIPKECELNFGMNTSSDKINQQRSLTRYGVLTKKEVFKWNIHISAILNSDGDKRSDFFTFGPSNDAKFYLLLPATDSELSAPPFCSSSQFNLFLCRVWNNLEGKGQDTEMKIKVAISLLDLRERLHYTCERVMKDEDRVTATFDRSCYDKYHLTFLRDSYMTIHCALDVDEVIKESNSSKETCALVNFSDELYTKDLVSDFSSLLDSGLHSDVTLSVDGKDFQVHRAVLSARSEVFAAMFEHDTLEKKQNRVVIEDISSDAMSQLLKFLYTGQTGDMSVQAALALFVASDKYALPKLKSKCSDYLCYNIPVDMMLNVLIVANLHEDDTLKQAAIQGILNNAVQVMKSDDWLMFLKEYSELANNIILQLAMKSVQI